MPAPCRRQICPIAKGRVKITNIVDEIVNVFIVVLKPNMVHGSSNVSSVRHISPSLNVPIRLPNGTRFIIVRKKPEEEGAGGHVTKPLTPTVCAARPVVQMESCAQENALNQCWNVPNSNDIQEYDLFKEVDSVVEGGIVAPDRQQEQEEAARPFDHILDMEMDFDVEEALKHLQEAASESAREWNEQHQHIKQEVEDLVVVEPNRAPEVVEEIPTVVTQPKTEVEARPPRQSKVRARQTSKRLASQEDEEEPDHGPKPGKKLKLYQQKPFEDPEKERARLNAINAKRNRVRKQNEKKALEKQMELLRNEVVEVKEERDLAVQILRRHGLYHLMG